MLLQFTITNTLDLEDRLFELYEQIHTLVHGYLPSDEDDNDMSPLEDVSKNN